MRNKMRPIHPGEILKEEFMEPLKLSSYALAKALSVPTNRITAIVNETRGISGDTAIRLSLYFGNSVDFWMNLQKTFEIRKAEVEFDQNLRATIAKNAIDTTSNDTRKSI